MDFPARKHVSRLPRAFDEKSIVWSSFVQEQLCFAEKAVLQAVKRLRQKTHIIKACFQQAGLKL